MNSVDAEKSAAIMDPVGLHARPAVRLTQLAKKFSAEIEIRPESSDKWVNAKSVSRLMRLKARHREKLYLRANGEDAKVAVNSLAGFIASGFE